MNKNLNNNNFTFKDVSTIINRYKLSILFITILFTIIGYSYIYFKPNFYSSYAIIKVKPTIKSNKSEDLINNTITTTKPKDVKEDITLLKTFKINKKVLKEIDYSVQYFIDNGYKKVEIYDNIPIEIKNIKILDSSIIGKRLTLIPKNSGFYIKYINSFKEKIKNRLFKTKLFSLEDKNSTLYHYGKKIKNNYFTLIINRKSVINKMDKPIHFIINGKRRDIFEKIIKKNLNITQLEKDTSLIKIDFKDTIPSRAKLYVDKLIENFIKESIYNKNHKNIKTLKFITKELNRVKKELSKSEQKLENYQKSKSIVKPSVQGTLFIKKLTDIESKISENRLKKRVIVDIINFVGNNYNLTAIAPSLSKLGENSTLKLIKQLEENQQEKEKLSLEYTDEHPKIISLETQIETLRAKIKFNLNSLNNNIDYQNKNLIEQKNSYENRLESLPSEERYIVNIKRSYEVKSRMYEYLLKKKAENKIIQFATFSDYQIIDKAYNSNIPLSNKKNIILLMSALIGFILAFILAFLRNSFNKNIYNKEDIKKITDIPLYGDIPFLRQKKYQLKVVTNPKSPFTEAFRSLRTNLQFMHKNRDATIILITSMVANEGKTTVSANLAKILEMAKYKTLIINLDIRKPTLHKFFNIDNSIGISNYLDGQFNEIEIIQPTEFERLDIIPSGSIPDNPSELILSTRLPMLFKKLKTVYDYIIVDTAPIGIVADTKTIIKYTDLNLILLKEKVAKKEFISTIENMILQYQFENVGLILNASKTLNKGEYGYGYSYEYK